MNGAILRGVIAWDIKMDKNEATSVYNKILDRYPQNMEAYFAYWEFLNKIGEKKRLDEVSENMIEAAQNTNVPTREWMKAHLLRAKTLLMSSRPQEAIDILKRQIYIIPPLSIPGLSYFKDGKIVIEEDDQDLFIEVFDLSMDGENIQKDTAGDTSNGTIILRSSGFKPSTAEKYSETAMWNKRTVSFKNAQDNIESLRFSFNTNTPQALVSSSSKSSFEGKSGTETEDQDIHYEIEGFSVSTDVDFLYQIGKICAESGIKLDEGIKSLNDFCLILDYYNQDMDQRIYKKMKTQAKFYTGVLYFRKRNIESTEIVLREIIDDIKEIEGENGPRYKETEKLLSKCFKERLAYQVKLIEDYFYPS